MKFITILAAIVAGIVTLVVATPMDPTTESTTNVNIMDRDDCDDCNKYFDGCYGGLWCWFNPTACLITCKRETCQNNGEKCHNKCGYEC
ncbi:hypothetical protein EK21DRAFT_116687 [Setomelanomma holmii]|uniref:Uncharacterized protein n=1 Tax=Setomelanomma holmii TaxID=210430 RepID=A0A9P4H2H9_9PLEO|nr:hypothetical protein EK21DRAFT_116687 [Setomelanomma holmii]